MMHGIPGNKNPGFAAGIDSNTALTIAMISLPKLSHRYNAKPIL
jgi:hypothetical protein